MISYIFLISIILSIIPIALIGYLFYKKDTIKEPKKLLMQLFAAGVLSGIIVFIISIIGITLFPDYTNLEQIDNIFTLLFYSYIFIGLVEESSKLFMIYKGAYNNKCFDQAYDIILYSVFVSLGFAFFENIIYLLKTPGIDIALLRSITAVPIHICLQVIMGYFLYLSKTKNKKIYIFYSLIITTLLHGTYDFLIFTENMYLISCDLLLLISILIYAYYKVKTLIDIDKSHLNNYCPNCEQIIEYAFCPHCGYKKNN